MGSDWRYSLDASRVGLSADSLGRPISRDNLREVFSHGSESGCLYFDKQEDALLFTLAASSIISDDGPARADEALVKVAAEIRKANRITTEVFWNHPTSHQHLFRPRSGNPRLQTG